MESSKALPPYQYRPLERSPDSFRLLLLDAGTNEDETLCGSLVTRKISSFEDELNTHYAALSYVWGDPSRTKIIELVVGGERFQHGLTANLYDALKNIREENRAILIWADAICIDQNNISERGHQVRLMGNIYRSAGCTVIYLGHLNSIIKLLFEGAPDPPVAERKRAAEDFCSREWFSRGWVFQELVLSRNPRVQVGRYRKGWSQLYSEVYWVLPATRSGDMVRMMNQALNNHESRTFSQLVIARKGAQVNDARDYFFCLMGIASDARQVQETLHIDYSQSANEVFIRAAYYMLNDINLHAVIAHVDSDSVKFGLPSFVPTWGVKSLESMSHYRRPLPLRPPPGGANVTESCVVRYDTEDFSVIEDVSDILLDYSQFSTSFLKNFKSWLYSRSWSIVRYSRDNTIQEEDPTLEEEESARLWASFCRIMDFGDPGLIASSSFSSEPLMLPEELFERQMLESNKRSLNDSHETQLHLNTRRDCLRDIWRLIVRTAHELPKSNLGTSTGRSLGYRWAYCLDNHIARVPITAERGHWLLPALGDDTHRRCHDQYVFRPIYGEIFVLDSKSIVRDILERHGSIWKSRNSDGGQGRLSPYRPAIAPEVIVPEVIVPEVYGKMIGLAQVFTEPENTYSGQKEQKLSFSLVLI